MQDIENYSMILAILGLLMMGCLAYRLLRKKRFDLFEPYYLVWLIYFAVMVIAPAIWLAEGRTMRFGYEIMAGLPKASLVFGVAFVVFTAAYIRTVDTKLRMLPLKTDLSRSPGRLSSRSIVVLCQIGFVLVTVTFVLGTRLSGINIVSLLTLQGIARDVGVTDSSTIVALLMMSCDAYIPILTTLFAFQKRARITLLFQYLFVLLVFIARGYRYVILVLLFSPVIYSFLKNGKRPKAGHLLACLVLFFLVISLLGVTRDSLRAGSAIEAFSFADMVNTLMPNIEVFFPYYREVLLVPDYYPHAFGVSYLYLIIQFIPRALWPGKPVQPYSGLVDYMFGVSANTGMEYVNLGEMYLNFGFAGTVIFMGLLGVLFGHFVKLYRGETDKVKLVTYSMLLVFLLQFSTRGNFPSVATQMFFIFFPMYVFYVLGKNHSRNVGGR